MSTSLRPTRVVSTSTPSADLRSSVMSRLLRLMTRYAADSPSLWGGHVRDSSPEPRSSTLITSAPRSASSMPQKGPARTREQSMTRTPSSARRSEEHTSELQSRLHLVCRLLLEKKKKKKKIHDNNAKNHYEPKVTSTSTT